MDKKLRKKGQVSLMDKIGYAFWTPNFNVYLYFFKNVSFLTFEETTQI